MRTLTIALAALFGFAGLAVADEPTGQDIAGLSDAQAMTETELDETRGTNVEIPLGSLNNYTRIIRRGGAYSLVFDGSKWSLVWN